MHQLKVVKLKGNKLFFTANGLGQIHDRRLKDGGMFSYDKVNYRIDLDTKQIHCIDNAVATNAPTPYEDFEVTPIESEFDINKRFEFIEKFTNMVLDGILNSAIITGEGGLGKSHTVISQLEKRGLKEETDYVVVKGYSTPKALYATLYEHNGKIVIFDDCDSVLKDVTALNLLKGALDSYDRRTISWLSKGFIDDGLPSSFDFEGQVIFISNMPSIKMDGAVKSRSVCVDVSMTIKDKIERMNAILNEVLPEYPLSMKREVLNYLETIAHIAKEFNMRTLQKAIKVRYAYDTDEWKDAVKYLLTSV